MLTTSEKIKVYDNILSTEDQDKIENILTGTEFPWFFGEYTVDDRTVYKNETLKNSDPNIKEYPQFTHGFYRQEPFYVSPLYKDIQFLFENFTRITNIKVSDILRIKANLQTQCSFSNTHFYNTPHRDQPIDHTVVIYYVNDSDGDTFIFDDNQIIKQITPKKGRFLLFDGKYFHSGRHPIQSTKRILLNYNFL